MILGFRDTDTEKVFQSISVRKFQAIERIALRKLIQINQARSLRDLSALPGNRLELLHEKGRKGQYSIRVNDQYRICFRWQETDAFEVELTDYH